IKESTRSCVTSQELQNSQPKESLKLTEYPPGIQLKLTFFSKRVQFCQKDTEGPKQQQAHEANIQ
ncbi:hypothetical protein P5673_018545, partial [Acropora cervicornis]